MKVERDVDNKVLTKAGTHVGQANPAHTCTCCPFVLSRGAGLLQPSEVCCATGGTGSKPDGQGGSVQVDPVQVGRVDVVQVDLVQVDQWIYSMLFTLVNSRWKR